KLIAFIPRDQIVQKAEIRRQTVIQYAPDCNQAQVYRELAQKVLDNKELTIPTTMTFEELEAFMAEMGVEDTM
ncbi:MAG: nitrogenase iron protein, partial [Acidaminococcaceae bacterium]|nr:nitrogenase iron protein [Acidaminococcaceae bacterium]